MAEPFRSFITYLHVWFQELRHDFRSLVNHRIKFFITLFLAWFFMMLIGWGFYRVILYVKDAPVVGTALVSRLVATVFLALFILLIYSSVITAFSTLYFSNDNYFLVISPFNWGGVLLGKLVQTAFYSSWMSAIVIVPLLAVLGIVFKLPWHSYFIFAGGLLGYFLTAAAAGALGVVIVVNIFPARKVRDLLIVGLVVFGTTLYVLFRLLNLEQILRPGQETIAASYLKVFAVPKTPYLPSYWLSKMVNLFINRSGGWFTPLAVLVLLSLAIAFVYYLVSNRFFYSGWEKVQSEEKKRYFREDFPQNPILAKDTLTFFRDTSQWTQLLLIIALIVVYLFNVYKMPLDIPYLHYLISFFNIGMVGFVVAAVGLRFSFSSISLEGRYFWLLLSSPLDMKKVLKLKYLENFIPLQVLAMILVTVSNYILKVPVFLNILSTVTVFFAGIAITSMGVGMGCMYPKLDASSPAEVETSWGGIMYMIYSFFYLGITLALEAVWVRMYFMNRIYGSQIYVPAVALIIAVLVIINILVNVIPVKFGMRALRKIEFSV